MTLTGKLRNKANECKLAFGGLPKVELQEPDFGTAVHDGEVLHFGVMNDRRQAVVVPQQT